LSWAAASVYLRNLIIALVAIVVTEPVASQSIPNQEQRFALVFGNSDYPDQPLKNPANDARVVATSLRKLGFQVIERINAKRSVMELAVLEFGEKLKSGGVGLFYYAGHGIQARGQNYLIPVDAEMTSEAAIRFQAVEVSKVLDFMAESRNRANIVILDACRNNPFRDTVRGAPTGLAAIDAARGTLIAYSTAPGRVAVDGDGANSPYTAALVRSLDEPGLKAEELFKRVRIDVADVTRGTQTPWESSSLTGDLVLNPSETVKLPQATTRDAADLAFWNAISTSQDPREYEDYLSQFPQGTFSPLAKRRLAESKRKQEIAEAERSRAAEAAALKQQRVIEETERKRREAEEFEKKKVAVEAERKRAADAERARREAEEFEKKKVAVEAERKRAADADRARREADEEQKRKLAEEEERRQLAALQDAERQRRAETQASRTNAPTKYVGPLHCADTYFTEYSSQITATLSEGTLRFESNNPKITLSPVMSFSQQRGSRTTIEIPPTKSISSPLNFSVMAIRVSGNSLVFEQTSGTARCSVKLVAINQ